MILFLSSSRGCSVICEHLGAPQAVGIPDNPINHASLTQLSDILFSFLSRKEPFGVDGLTVSFSHAYLSRLPVLCLHWRSPSGWGGFKTCLTSMPVFFLGPDPNMPFLWPFSYTLKFPVASFPWFNRWYQAIGHIFIFNFLSNLPREPSMKTRQKFFPF